MKKLFKYALAFVAILSSVVCFTACSNDDEPSVDNNYGKEIVGTWKVTSPSTDLGTDDSFVFNADGTLTWHNGSHTKTNNTYQLKGNELRIDLNIWNGVVDATTLGTISLSGKNMTYRYKWNENGGKGWSNEEVVTLTKN